MTEEEYLIENIKAAKCGHCINEGKLEKCSCHYKIIINALEIAANQKKREK